jgi:hypothetical protein
MHERQPVACVRYVLHTQDVHTLRPLGDEVTVPGIEICGTNADPHAALPDTWTVRHDDRGYLMTTTYGYTSLSLRGADRDGRPDAHDRVDAGGWHPGNHCVAPTRMTGMTSNGGRGGR